MSAAAPAKTCHLCGLDCANRPRTKDRKGRYFCTECYERQIARQRKLRGETGPSAPVRPAPSAPAPVIPASPAATPVRTPAAPTKPAHHELPPIALAPSGIEHDEVAPLPMPVPHEAAPAIPIAPASPRVQSAPPPEPPPVVEPIAPKIDSIDAVQSGDSVSHAARAAVQSEILADVASIDDVIAPQARQQDLDDNQPETEECDDVSADAPPVVWDIDWEHEADETPSTIESRADAGSHSDRGSAVPFQRIDHDVRTEIPISRAGGPPPSVPAAPFASIEPLPRSPKMMLLEDGPPAAAFAGCPHCRRPIPTGAIVCVGCGYNLLDGSINADAVYQPVTRLKPRSTWTGPLLLGSLITLSAAAAAYSLFGSRIGVFAFGMAFLIAVPLWFIWALIDARDTEGAQLKIWLVPGYIFAWVFGESRSRYLRAGTVGVIAIIVAFAALGYQWRRLEREQQRAHLRQPPTTMP